MKPLFIHVFDPSGHRRTIKLHQFPAIFGTNLLEKNQLRDQGLPTQAFILQRKGDSQFEIKTIAPNLSFQVGDFRFTSLELPFFVPLKISQTELSFSLVAQPDSTIEFPVGEQAWFTESKSGRELLSALRKASLTKLSIYLCGETGTGKEVLAKLAHLWSERSKGSFVPINCGALAISLAESELFGHVKGSFTGAMRDRPGALLQAHGGTLFLDEVADLPLELQVKLLRFLENGEIRPVGSDRVVYADVRILCATHKPLLKLVQEGKFRQDLYFRLASIPIEIPPLRARFEDIRALAIEFAKDHGKSLTEESIMRLLAHPWPGNVRELRHAVERACGLAGPFAPVIHSKDFEFLIVHPLGNADAESDTMPHFIPGVANLKEMERILILRSLKLSRGNRTDAAKILGVARSTLFEMMKRHTIVGPKTSELWSAEL